MQRLRIASPGKYYFLARGLHILWGPVSEMTYIVSSGTLNSSIPYLSCEDTTKTVAETHSYR